MENGRFVEILPESVPADAVDLQGAYVIPGLVDVHNHGNSGRDFSDGDYEGLKTMAAYLGRCGVTSFAPASMTLPYDVLAKAFATAKRLKEEAPAGLSRLMGIQMEGPFFSEKKKEHKTALTCVIPILRRSRPWRKGVVASSALWMWLRSFRALWSSLRGPKPCAPSLWLTLTQIMRKPRLPLTLGLPM
ncbi:MAG: hypothetical protein ACLSHU_07740 [Oscillospiraceae bacterium]